MSTYLTFVSAMKLRAPLRFPFCLALGVALVFAHAANAEDIAAQWRGVTRIQGSIFIESKEWIDEEMDQVQSSEVAEVRFEMAVDRSTSLPHMTWRAESAMVVGSLHHRGHNRFQGSVTNDADFKGPPANLGDFTMSLDTETGVWQIVSPGFLQEEYTRLTVWTGPDPQTFTTEMNTIQSTVFDGTVSGTPGVTMGKSEVVYQYDGKTTRGGGRTGRIRFSPEFEDVDLEITIADYAKWRPLGSIQSPGTPGNGVVARATLMPRDGKDTPLPKVKEFRFKLIDTSREPGVCLNWPLNAKDQDFDLRLAPAPAFDGILSNNNQALAVSESQDDRQDRPYAEAKIDSYDFGAKSELLVSALLEDGREVSGAMKDANGVQEIVRLPRRLGADWIAASWREDKQLGKLADDDDDEEVEGQEHNGDGFTLYEEYRGWVEKGRHIEGDPKKKDFFVLNLIGADAEPGIELFEDLSKLRVHSKLRRSEMSQTTRLMNGNHFNAPQRVKQHGVWVKVYSLSDLGDSGAATVMLKKGVVGRPGLVKGIGILARDNEESSFNKPFNLPAEDAIFAFDRAIAHELLHSVGVEHHGTGDYEKIVGYASPRNPYNKLGKPYYGSEMGKPIELLDEAGHDVAARDYEDYVKFRQFMDLIMLERTLEEGRQYIARNGAGYNGINSAEQYADIMIEILGVFPFMNLRGIVGIEHGEHSGHQDCVMRYSFAKFYEKKDSAEKTLYLVTPGSERIGMEICLTPAGTGNNASSFKPQSRYGDATSAGGNSFGQICPNDAIPPRATN